MKKLLTFLMAVALILVPVRAFADEFDDVTVGYEIVSDEDYYDDEDEFYDDYEDDYDDYDYEDDYDDYDYDDEEYDYYDDDILTFDEQVDLVESELDAEEENNVSLSVCTVVLLATVPFIAGLLVGAGVMLLSYKTVKKEEDEKKKENKKNDK